MASSGCLHIVANILTSLGVLTGCFHWGYYREINFGKALPFFFPVVFVFAV